MLAFAGVVLIALAVIFVPILLDGSGTPEQLDLEIAIPERDEVPTSQFDEAPEPPELQSGDAPDQSATPTNDAPTTTLTSETPGDGEEAIVSGWVVQVGSFTEDTNARVLRDRLREQGFAAFVEQTESDGDSLWRVRVGPVASKSEAQTLGERLQALRGQSVLVMSYP